MCQDDDLFDAIYEMTSMINDAFCLLGAPMMHKDFEEGDYLSAIEWSISALGDFSKAIMPSAVIAFLSAHRPWLLLLRISVNM